MLDLPEPSVGLLHPCRALYRDPVTGKVYTEDEMGNHFYNDITELEDEQRA